MIEFNPEIVNDLANRRAILFLGAGVSASAITNTGKRFPEWKDFLTEAANRIQDNVLKNQIKQFIENRNYLFASELIKKSLQQDWQELLEKEFRQLASPSDLHKAIVSLDQRILVTTNFDMMIEDAWRSSFRSKSYHPHILKKVDDRAFRLFRDDDDYIIKIHGCISEPDSIVFDTTSYQQRVYSNSFYEELLNSLLLTHTFLFIGFSMSDPAISLIIETFAHRFPNSRPHYIFSADNVSDAVRDLSKSLRKLYILPYSPENNHLELITKIKDLGELVRKRRAEILARESFRQPYEENLV